MGKGGGPQSTPNLLGMKTSAVLLLCLAWAQTLAHHPMEDTDLEHQVKERIERDTGNIEVGEAETKLQETGEDILYEVKFTLDVINKMVQFLAPLLGFDKTQFYEQMLKKMEHDANDIKGGLEDIKDDLPTIVTQLVEGRSKLTKLEMEAMLRELKQVTNMKAEEKLNATFFSLNATLSNRENVLNRKPHYDIEQAEKEFEKMQTDFLATNIDNIVQFVAPVMGWSETEEEETKTWLQELGQDILKNITEKLELEDRKDDLIIRIILITMVEGLVSRGWTWTGLPVFWSKT